MSSNIPEAAQRCEASTGPISANEDLAYGLYSPDVFDPQTGELTAQAIQIEHLTGKRSLHVDLCGYSSGVSVCRLVTQTSLNELWQALEAIVAKNSQRQTEGYAIASVRSIWDVEGPNKETRPLDVLDDGRLDYATHAVIRSTLGLSRGALRGPRDDLVTLFNAQIVRRDASNM